MTARTAKAPRLLARLGAAQVAVAIIALAGMPILAADVLAGWSLVFRIVAVVLPGALVLGVTLPLASSLIAPGHDRVGKDAGILLGSNTLGAICGTFLIPFVAIPIIGSPRSLVLLALVNALLGIALIVRDSSSPRGSGGGRRRRHRRRARRDPRLRRPERDRRDPGVNRMARGGTVFATTEDEIASVQAGNIRGARLWVGGNGMTALTVDAKLMPLLPIILRPQASRMLVIGFGMGSAFRMALGPGSKSTGWSSCRRSPKCSRTSTRMRRSPRRPARPGDRRRRPQLRGAVEPDVRHRGRRPTTADRELGDGGPVFAGVLPGGGGTADRRRRDDGVDAEGQTVDEFRAHVRTFESVFPNVQLAFGPGTHGVFMLGSTGSVAMDPAAVASVLGRPGVVTDLDEAIDARVSTLDQWKAFIPTTLWLGGAEVAAFAGSSPLITDDHPITEYFLLRRAFGPSSPPMTVANLRKAAGR